MSAGGQLLVFLAALGYLLWFGGIAKMSVSTASVFIGVLPVSAVLLSYLILGEPFSWVRPVVIACVLLAILLIAGSGRVPERARSTALRNFLPSQSRLRATGRTSLS